MENNTTSPKNNQSSSGKTSLYIVVAAVLVVVAIPVFFLLQRNKKNVPAATANNIASLEAAVKSNPDFANLVNLSLAYINNSEPSKAVPVLKKAYRLSPQSAIVFNNLGVCYIMQKNYSLALNACTKAVTLDPSFQLAKNNLRWAADEEKKARAALAEMQKTPADKRDISYYIETGLKYYQLGDYDNAMILWKEGLAKDSNNPMLMNNIGSALVMRKEYDTAIEAFNLVLKLNPADQLAKNNIQWALLEKNDSIQIFAQ